jgi:hypothetical protein
MQDHDQFGSSTQAIKTGKIAKRNWWAVRQYARHKFQAAYVR